MVLLKLLGSFWLTLSALHLILFYSIPQSTEPHPIWNFFIQPALSLNLACSLIFECRVFRGLNCDIGSARTFLIGTFLALIYIWAVVGLTCVIFFSTDISNVISLYWASSLFFVGIALTLLIHSAMLGFSYLLTPTFFTLKHHQLFHFLMALFSLTLTAFIFLNQSSLDKSTFIFTQWSFIASSFLLLFQALFCKQQSPDFFLDMGFIRLKRVFHSLTHFITFEGPVLFSFLLQSHPSFFLSHPVLSLLFLFNIATVTPLFLITYYHSISLDLKSPFALVSLSSNLLEHFHYCNESMLAQSLYSFIFLLPHFAGFERLYYSQSFKAWLTFPALLPLLTASFLFIIRRVIFKQQLITFTFLRLLKGSQILFDIAILTLQLLWTIFWIFASDYSNTHYQVILALSIALFFTIILKTVFWHYKYDKFILQNQHLYYNEMELQEIQIRAEDEQLLKQNFQAYLNPLNCEFVNDCECSICLASLKGQGKVSTLQQCEHQFHDDCIIHWLQTKKCCPLDRKPLI